MKLAIKNSLMLLAIAFSLFQCGQSESTSEDEHGHGEEAHGGHEEEEGHEEGENEGVVELSDIQLTNADLQYGSLDTLNVSGFVKANGILDLPPQNIAAVSAPMDGFVKKANYLVGDYVEKGTVLAVLEHMDYIKLQEEYLNLVNNLEYLKSEYERQRQLDSAAVTSKKQFQAASAAYKSAQARKKALEKQLHYMGLSPERVAAREISSTIAIRAPFSGYVTALNVHNGTFAQSEQELYELVDTDHMHLELNIFEQDMRKVKIGQPIRFAVPSIGNENYRGEVFLVGKSFDQENKTIKVHGHIEGEHENFIRGL
jgi:cobalt-zinc-cadmium efflux system membrane fusion protein